MKQNINIEAEGNELENFADIPLSTKNKSGIYFININKNLYIGSQKGVSLAKEYNVSTFCISLIKLNKTYKHINRDEI